MTELIIVIAVAYLLFHLGAGHTHYRYRKAAGLQPNFYSSSIRGLSRSRQTTPRSAPSMMTTPIAISRDMIANTTPIDPYFL